MGEVFRGEDSSGEPVAIKVMRPDLFASPDLIQRFQREVDTLTRLSGRHLARYIDSGTHAGRPWVATQFVDGPTLAERVTSAGALPLDEVRRLADHLITALSEIHDAGVVHRDLTPNNVLLGNDHPMVVDFGIAKVTTATTLTVDGQMMGTPAWMSPEQAKGEEVGPASDVFALGSLVVFAASGREPFRADTNPAHLYRIVHSEPTLTGMPAALLDFVNAALQKDPTARPALGELRQLLHAGRPPAIRALAKPLTLTVAVALLSSAMTVAVVAMTDRSEELHSADRRSDLATVGNPDPPQDAMTVIASATPESVPTPTPTSEMGGAVTRDGTRPAVGPDCIGFFGACVGDSTVAVAGHLGPPTTVEDDGAVVSIEWQFDGYSLSTIGPSAAATADVMFLVNNESVDADIAIAGPGDIAIGRTPIGEVPALAAAAGWVAADPPTAIELFGNGLVSAAYRFVDPETLVELEFAIVRAGSTGSGDLLRSGSSLPVDTAAFFVAQTATAAPTPTSTGTVEPPRSADSIPEVWTQAPAGQFGRDIEVVLASATDRLGISPTQLCGDLSTQNAWAYNGQDGLVIYGDAGQYVGWHMGPDAIDFPYAHRFGAHIGAMFDEMANYPGASLGGTGFGTFIDSRTDTEVSLSFGFIDAADRETTTDRLRTMAAGDTELSCG